MKAYLLKVLTEFVQDPLSVDLASLEGTTAPTLLSTLLYVMMARPKLVMLENVSAVEVLLGLITRFLSHCQYSFRSTMDFDPSKFKVPNNRTRCYMVAAHGVAGDAFGTHFDTISRTVLDNFLDLGVMELSTFFLDANDPYRKAVLGDHVLPSESWDHADQDYRGQEEEQDRHADAVGETALDVQTLAHRGRNRGVGHDGLAQSRVRRRQDRGEDRHLEQFGLKAIMRVCGILAR